MNDEPHAHETLVAKARRSGYKDPETGSTSSEESLSGSVSSVVPAIASNERPPETVPAIQPSLRIYLLEPFILILLFAYNFSSTVLKNEVIYQSCTSGLGYPDNVCRLLGTKNATNETKRIEEEVQPYAARVTLVMRMVECFIPAFCGLFAGAWADRYGRKPLLMCSFLGYGLQYLISAIIAYWAIQTHGLVSPWWYVLSILPISCLGSSVTYSVAAVCFIGDVSEGKVRSYRLIAYELAIYVGLLLGSFGSGYVYEATDAYVVLSISAGSILAALFLLSALLPESLPKGDRSATTPANDRNVLSLLKDMWNSCSKPREHHNRSIMLTIMVVLLLTAFVADGSNSVFYLFMRAKFHWSVKQFTEYESVSILVPAVAGSGGVLFIWSLRKCTNSAVLWLALVSLLSHSSSSLMKAFAMVSWQIYVAIGLGVFKSLVNPMCRTMITNLLPADERGKIFALLGVVQNLSPLVSSSLYYAIYTRTLDSDPGIFNLFSTFLYSLGIILLGFVWLEKTKNRVYYVPLFR
ncbi:probable peptidoglycan muropeptide transporter SLC46 isoform X2 [Drosophila kikkawai]|uniref:Probable peptidoglycan muropeptide transporter SLC46 isoform X2 n=1 Tax=Drosophila kikkawai TaxID=30033 RepID=A0A6P4IXM0_DROKI|nr:proton-coupled folate transporter [Drosophila kikkawai]